MYLTCRIQYRGNTPHFPSLLTLAQPLPRLLIMLLRLGVKDVDGPAKDVTVN